MDLLLSIVNANAKAKALASAAAQSLHAVDDCSCVVECCTKVLPAALSALEGAASHADGLVRQAVESVQGCITAMVQLQTALEGLNLYDSEGVLGILLKHPAAWLDTYRAFRALTTQLVGMSCLIREAAQRSRADECDEALRNCVKALTGICSRSRDAANVLGSDLPDFARAAAATGWTSGHLRCAVAPSLQPRTGLTASGALSPCWGCCRECGRRSSCNCCVAAQEVDILATATSELQQHQLPLMQQQRKSLLRRIGMAAACGSPVQRGLSGGGAPLNQALLSESGCGSGHAWLQAGTTLVTRIQDTILYDSEVDQLEQDRAYLRQLLAHLTAISGGAAATTVLPVMAEDATTVGHPPSAAVAASLIQSELLLAAVDFKLTAMGEGNDGSGEMCGSHPRRWEERQKAVFTSGGGSCGESVVGKYARVRSASGPYVDTEDLYVDVRRRCTALRWLPVCFVGA